MNTYDLPNSRRLRTNAQRRWLIVSVFERRPKVEASTDDEAAAGRLIARYRRDFAPRCELHLLDQAGLGGS